MLTNVISGLYDYQQFERKDFSFWVFQDFHIDHYYRKKTKSKVQFHANVDIGLAIINAFKKQHHSWQLLPD